MLITPEMSETQILVTSTTVDSNNKVYPNMSYLGSEHQNKPLVLRIRLLQSGKCLKAPNKGI